MRMDTWVPLHGAGAVTGGSAAPGAGGQNMVTTLGGCAFHYISPLLPDRDTSGAIIVYSPQRQYKKHDSAHLHKHGHGTFCRFRILVSPDLIGVYTLLVDGEIRYIGECIDLGKRFNAGYGIISPKNCYDGGQPTNCKINHRVIDVSKAGRCVNLLFHETTERKAVEKQLVARYSPPWNH